MKEEKTEDLNESFSSNSSSRGKFEVPALSLESCPSFERKFIVCDDRLSTINLYELPHPRANRSALYQIDDVSVAEVLQIDAERSCFYGGDSVVKNFTLTMVSPIHPLFILIPNLLKQTGPFTLKELTTDSNYPALSLLARIPATQKALNLACDRVSDGRFVQNEKRLLDWMEKRFEILMESLKEYDGLPAGAVVSNEAMRYFAFEIFADYIPDSVSDKLKLKWHIEKPATASMPTPTAKRKANKNMKSNLKSSSKSSSKLEEKKRKVLADASKNTMKLNMFF